MTQRGDSRPVINTARSCKSYRRNWNGTLKTSSCWTRTRHCWNRKMSRSLNLLTSYSSWELTWVVSSYHPALL